MATGEEQKRMTPDDVMLSLMDDVQVLAPERPPLSTTDREDLVSGPPGEHAITAVG